MKTIASTSGYTRRCLECRGVAYPHAARSTRHRTLDVDERRERGAQATGAGGAV